MMTPTPKFRGQVLQQVYRVWLVRKLLPILVIEILLLSVILYKFAERVFVARVVENASNVFFQRPSGIIGFFVAAFTHTSFPTKIFSLALVVVAALFLRHITQGLLRFILVRQNFFAKNK